MRPFELPDFYRPWPPRLNPHVDRARAHNRAWAHDRGLIDASVWDEATIDSTDLALFAAYCFPDADAPTLELVTDWYVWGFYFDDWFLEHYKRSGEVEAAAEWLAEVRRFTPVDLADEIPEPLDPVQAVLAELWARTVPGTSAQWRERFAHGTFAQMDDAFWELENLRAGRVPNPIDYLERRRGSAAGRWVADMAELVAKAELPAEVVATRQVQVLRDTFTDAQLLLNDIFSYQREIEREGELHNFVLVLQEFLGQSAQEAADTTNDLLTSRLLQFESTALTELPEMELSPEDRAAVLTLARSLQDINAGSHEWHLRSSRYMNETTRDADPRVPVWRHPSGLGTSAARLWAHHRPVDRRPPAVRPPAPRLPVRTNPHAARARSAATAWARRMGLPSCDAAANRAADAHPGAARDRMETIAQWYTLLAALDGRLSVHKAAADVAGGKHLLARLPGFLAEPGPVPLTDLERGLADLWRRTAPELASPAAFAGHFGDLVAARDWELGNTARHRVPDAVDYLQTRRAEGAGFHLDLLAYGTDGFVRPSRALAETFADVGTALADLAAHRARVTAPGEFSDGVLTVQRLLGCTGQRAADIVGDLAAARLAQFDRIAAAEGTDEPTSAALRGWLAGHQQPAPFTTGPTGLGTTGALAWLTR